MKATWQAVVVPINIEAHPDADRLGIVRVDEHIVVVNKEMWAGKTKGIYIPCQNAVDTLRNEFSFLKKTEARWVEVKPIKLRGVYSDGLLIPCDESLPVGTDMTEALDVHHVDHESSNKELKESGDRHCFTTVSKYDVDGIKHVKNYFTHGLPVVVTEKIHGENCGVGFIDEKLRVRSRSNWLADGGHFVDTVRTYENIIRLCQDNPNHIVYGELYGKASKGGVKFRYGLPEYKQRGFIPFDIMKPDRTFMDYEEFNNITSRYDVETAPAIFIGPYSDDIFSFASGQSFLGQHIREGVVVRPTVEGQTQKFQRLIFKLINPEYSAL